MGREVKRVPLEFKWPLHDVWAGYLTPAQYLFPACPDCRYTQSYSTGLTPEAYAIAYTFYPHMIGHSFNDVSRQHAESLAWHDKLSQREVDHLISKGRLVDFTHTPTSEGWVPKPDVHVTAAMVNDAEASAGLGFRGHDSINRSILVSYRCELLGISMECETCHGHCDLATDAKRAEADAWQPVEPPTGPGWQLWETVSEGSPVSPVFSRPEDLASWLVSDDPDELSRASSYEGALEFVTGERRVPSFIVVGNDVQTGIARTTS